MSLINNGRFTGVPLIGFKVLEICLTSYLPRLFKKDMLTDPEVFLKIISQNQDN